ncbi:uncharacterized protein LOC116173531 [Photinus pyralis]|uniref:uncharacterized protein LOC116170632 n=1 Tax=Photinus pyralis TaxID=7054 RepID=UPI00126707CF|nr:uncharacterized protein LOC116170632 [Photinus pyralis]XP_031346906.1 uncharacterized protein LOC116173531 [Photinus pyralis]
MENAYVPVVNENGLYIIENENVVLQNTQSGELLYHSINADLQSIFGIEYYEELQKQLADLALPSPNGTSTPMGTKVSWSHEMTLKLIHFLKLHQEDFKSTTIKNDAVYALMKDEMKNDGGNFTTSQIKDKVKYLKMRYMKKKDNMKATSSGAAAIQFTYYEEMDDIYGKKPNVEPIAVASSLRGRNLEDKKEDSDDVRSRSSSPPVTETASTTSSISPTPSVSRKRRFTEDDIERRHKERLSLLRELQQKSIENFNMQMNKLLDKL